MQNVANIGGYGVSYWGAEHKTADGKLICRQVIVDPPDPIQCPKLSCVFRFMGRSIMYILVVYYHQIRVTYAEKNRDKNIPQKYRTGEDCPGTFGKLLWEILRMPRA